VIRDWLAGTKQREQDSSSPFGRVGTRFKYLIGQPVMKLGETSRDIWRALDWARVAGLAAGILVNIAFMALMTQSAPATASGSSLPVAGNSVTPTTSHARIADDGLYWIGLHPQQHCRCQSLHSGALGIGVRLAKCLRDSADDTGDAFLSLTGDDVECARREPTTIYYPESRAQPPL
jgi:hypothetical protein